MVDLMNCSFCDSTAAWQKPATAISSEEMEYLLYEKGLLYEKTLCDSVGEIEYLRVFEKGLLYEKRWGFCSGEIVEYPRFPSPPNTPPG